MHEAHVISFGIARSVDDVYAFIADPGNYPKWAAVIANSFHQIGPSEWAAETEFGPRLIRFCALNEFGVLDHAVYKEGDAPLMMPMRVVANAEGCQLTFLFYRRSGTSDEQFRSAIEWVTTDFLALRSLLEVLG